MNFNTTLFIASMFIAATSMSCSESSPEKKTAQTSRIGDALQQSYTSFTGTVGSTYKENEAVYLDSGKRTLTIFQLEPFVVKESLKLPENVDASAFFAGKDNEFFVLKEKRGFGVLKRNGDYVKNPVMMYGSISSVSYDEEGQRLLLQDDLGSVCLAMLGPQGQIMSHWVGGPFIDGVHAAVAGTILSQGLLAVSLDNGQLASVDFDASINAGSWQYKIFDLPDAQPKAALASFGETALEGIGDDGSDGTEEAPKAGPEGSLVWLSRAATNSHQVVARSTSAIYLIDFDSSQILDQIAIEATDTPLHFSRSVGHVLLAKHADKAIHLIYAGGDGHLKDQVVRGYGNTAISANPDVDFSVVDPQQNTITIFASFNGAPSVLRSRFSDGLFISLVPVSDTGHVLISENYIVEVYDYVLGKARRVSVSNPDEEVVLKAYAVDLQRQ